MDTISLTVSAPFITTETEHYLQTILPGYDAKEETDECIELYRRGSRRRTVSKADITCAVLLDELMARAVTDRDLINKAGQEASKKIARRLTRELNKQANYYRPYNMRTPKQIKDLCTLRP